MNKRIIVLSSIMILYIATLQLSSFLLSEFIYNNYWFNVLSVIVNTAPYIAMMLYLFNVKIPKPPVDVYNYIAVANVVLFVILGQNGYKLQALFAYSIMLWVILYLGRRFKLDFTTTFFIATFSIFAISEVWEWSWGFTYGQFGNIALSFSRQGWGTLLVWSTTSRLLCLPFLGWILYTLNWKLKPWMAWASLAFMLWYLSYPALTYPVFPFDWNWQMEWIIRLPTIAFGLALIYGGLKNELP